jgi:hypothetical protein
MPDDVSEHPRFGRLLLRTRAAKGKIIFGCILLGILLLLVAAGAFTSYEGAIRFVIAVPIALFAIWLMTLGPKLARYGASFYETGFVAVTRKGRREAPYADVDTFKFVAVETRINGAHNHTTMGLTLKLREGEPVTISQQVPRNDTSFNEISTLLAGMIAGRLARELQQRGEVKWVDGVRIAPGTLLADGGFSGGQAKLRSIPFASISSAKMRDGKWLCFTQGASEPVLTLSSSDENFFPGLELLRRVSNG